VTEWKPTEYDIGWLKEVFTYLKEGGSWIAPITGQMFEKRGNLFVLMNEDIPDTSRIFERSQVIGPKIGIKVIKLSEVDSA
jgi:hypothetical protein